MAKYIPIDQIQAGMLLAEVVVNKFGQTLLPAGMTLTENHKIRLQTWGISSVAVKTEASEEEVEISSEVKAIALERIQQRMKWKPQNPLEEDMLAMAVRNTALIIIKEQKKT